MRNVAKKYNPSEENAAIIVSINKYGRVLSNWDYLKEIEKLEDRIYKAIEYIEDRFTLDEETGGYHLTHTFDSSNLCELYDILKGSDNNE